MVSLRVNQNELVSLLGNNASGKTTLINILVGLEKPDSGDVSLLGHSVSESAAKVREGIRLCQQFDFLFEELTVRQHLSLVCHMRKIPKSQVNSAVLTSLESLGLTPYE